MTHMLLGTFRPTTLAAMAADLSNFLSDEFDGDGVSAQQWDALAEELAAIVEQLESLTDDFVSMLMDAGADPDVIFEGAQE